MLLLVTLALVSASLVLLVLGFVQSALGFIYVSMVCAGVAGLALFVYTRLAQRRAAVLAAAGLSRGEWSDEVVFPIEGYDDLRVSEILPLLVELEADELQEVRDRETAGKARTGVTARIDHLLGAGVAAKAKATTKAAPADTSPNADPAEKTAAKKTP